jgi:hypothetical protein
LRTVAADRIEIRLSRAKVAAAPEAEGASQRPDLDPVVVSIEAKLGRVGKGKRLVIENGAEAEVNAGLAAMITETFAIIRIASQLGEQMLMAPTGIDMSGRRPLIKGFFAALRLIVGAVMSSAC